MANLEQEYDGQVTLDALLRVWQSKLLNDFNEGKDYFNIYVEALAKVFFLLGLDGR